MNMIEKNIFTLRIIFTQNFRFKKIFQHSLIPKSKIALILVTQNNNVIINKIHIR